MIATDVDPSLCSGEPMLESLDDGFSPPPTDPVPPAPLDATSPEDQLTTKSPF
jgi:hypothetical protein